MFEKQDEIISAVERDLHKHKLEIISGEISPVVGEIDYMLAVSTLWIKSKQMLKCLKCCRILINYPRQRQ